MRKHLSALLGTVGLAATALFLGGSEVQAQHGHKGGQGGGHPGGGAYQGGYRPSGSGYRPYYGYGGRGHGGYGNFSLYSGGYGIFSPYSGGYGYSASPVPGNPSPGYANPAVPVPTAAGQPPPDNAVHLQLIVPENAEVFFGDVRTRQTGKVREYVSPPLTPGEASTYRISVRSTGADGRPVNDTRDIRVHANDWSSIDFTRPAPPEARRVAPAGNLKAPAVSPGL
jgi:uncharacterized protein (TIGR03000 family)